MAQKRSGFYLLSTRSLMLKGLYDQFTMGPFKTHERGIVV